MRIEAADWIALLGLGGLASFLFLADLGEPYLWQDEAQTAVIARTILSEGIPHGTDGLNFFSQEGGVEYAEGYVWKWHTWLSFYVVAGAFASLGTTTFAARLPFALLGLLTVPLGYVAGRSFWRTRAAGLATGGLLALCVPYVILGRQCRWYALAACLVLLALLLYRRIGVGERRFSVALVAVTTAIFHTHYLYAATLLATLLIHALWLERERFRRTLVVCAAVTVLNGPWIVWFASARYGEAYAETLANLGESVRAGGHLLQDLVVYFPHPLFLLCPLIVVALRGIRGLPLFETQAGTRSAAALLLLFCGVNIVALALIAPGAYFRYLTPVVPAALLLAGGALGAVAALSRVAAVLVFVAWLALSPLDDFVHEITHGFDGPIEGIVRFLGENARPGDVVAISYGDMPLKFYTELRVIGGLTGEDLSQAAGADWIILRAHAFEGADLPVREALRAHLVPGEYVAHRLPYADTAFENREDPRFHRFRTPGPGHPRVVVYGRRERVQRERSSAETDRPG